MVSSLFDFAVTTIFAREFLEGAIIIGEYRTIILRSVSENKDEALRAIWVSALVATLFALVVIAAVAIPLIILSSTFDDSTSKIIEGISKIVAGVCLLQLSLKLPKFLGIYGSCKKGKKEGPAQADETVEDGQVSSQGEERRVKEAIPGLTMRSMQFNVAWNIWREVAECGVFLIPFFLSGEDLESIPVSAAIGSVVGLALGLGIYWANYRFKNKLGLAIFAVLLLVFLSAGLTTGGFSNLENEWGSSQVVWQLTGDFWDIDRLPMTVLKPFGYNDTRTVLQICVYWGWLLLSAVLHIRKYRRAPKITLESYATDHSKENSSNEDSADQPVVEDEESPKVGLKAQASDAQVTDICSQDSSFPSTESTEEGSDGRS
ncbi:hypothetical protein ACA910_015634 [Epithemia clementina (nom. ined.)]